MADIVEIAAGDRRLQLGNEEFGRTFAYGTKWTKLRMGFRVTWNNTSGNFNGLGLVFGLCQGTTAMWRDASCTDFIGYLWGSTYPAPSLWTSNATYYSSPGGTFNVQYLSKIAGVVTSGNTGNSSGGGRLDSVASIHQSFYFDITKQPGRVVMRWFTHASAGTDCNLDNFYRNMQCELMGNPSPGSPAMAAGAIFSLTYTGNALWDTVNIAWDRWNPLVQISDVLVSRWR